MRSSPRAPLSSTLDGCLREGERVRFREGTRTALGRSRSIRQSASQRSMISGLRGQSDRRAHGDFKRTCVHYYPQACPLPSICPPTQGSSVDGSVICSNKRMPRTSFTLAPHWTIRAGANSGKGANSEGPRRARNGQRTLTLTTSRRTSSKAACVARVSAKLP